MFALILRYWLILSSIVFGTSGSHCVVDVGFRFTYPHKVCIFSFSAGLFWLGFHFFPEVRLAQSQAGMCGHVCIRRKLVSIGDGQTGRSNCDETGEAIKAISVSHMMF